MQTIEKALHAPMPFTTGGQTISDRLTAAKHSLAGSQLGKTICKATTEELMAPKKKHLDYLLHCTNEPNVSIPSMANLLIERTQHPSWTIVYKALITIHNIMCYGNERFSQYLASCNTTFNLGNFLDKNSTSGYDMSQHVRRYGKYIGEKIATYRVCAFDFCKVKRGREDGLLRTMHTDKLLKTLPILQNQIDALLEFQVSSSELNNGVINCSFILLFRDLIRLFACYNDGIINLLEKYFDMNKKQCRDALDTYKGFLTRLDKVAEFLRVAESVGIDRGEIPDLTRAPASLLEALEAHLIHLEGGRPPPPTQQFQAVQSQVNNFSIHGGFQATPNVAETERQRYIELEKERLRQFEEQKRQGAGSAPSQFNPFAAEAAASNGAPAPKTNDDLLDLFNAPQANNMQQQQPAGAMDATNPFAQFGAAPPATSAPVYPQMGQQMNEPQADSNPFMTGAPAPHQQWQPDFGAPAAPQAPINPFAAEAGQGHNYNPSTQPFGDPNQPVVGTQPMGVASMGGASMGGASMGGASMGGASMGGASMGGASVGGASVGTGVGESAGSAPIPVAQQQRLGIYDQTPFSNMDGSYTAQPAFPAHMMQGGVGDSSAEQSPAHQVYTAPQEQQQLSHQDSQSTQQRMGGDIDSALSNLADNLNIGGNKAQPSQSVPWGNSAAPSRPPLPSTAANPPQIPYGGQQPMMGYNPGQAYPQQYNQGGMPPQQQQQQWGMQQQPGMYGMSAQPMQGYGMYSNQQQQPQQMPAYGMQQQAPPPQQQQQQPGDPFGGF